MYDSSLLLCSIRTFASFEFCQIYAIAFDESLLKWSTTNNIQFLGLLSTSIDKYLGFKCNAASTHSVILLIANIWNEFAIDYLINCLGSYIFLSIKDSLVYCHKVLLEKRCHIQLHDWFGNLFPTSGSSNYREPSFVLEVCISFICRVCSASGLLQQTGQDFVNMHTNSVEQVIDPENVL